MSISLSDIEKEDKSSLNPPSSDVARARRIKGLRTVMRLSRRGFEKRTGISPSTQQTWEDETGSSIGEQGIGRLMNAYKKLNVNVSEDWVMHGLGKPPEIDDQLLGDYSQATSKNYSLAEKEQLKLIEAEYELFKKHYKEANYLIVPDDSMAPRFVKDEWVAGPRFYKQAIRECVGQDCIVLTDNGDTLLRHIKKGSAYDYYNIVSANHLSDTAKPILYDIKLISAAPVIWSRRILPKA